MLHQGKTFEGTRNYKIFHHWLLRRGQVSFVLKDRSSNLQPYHDKIYLPIQRPPFVLVSFSAGEQHCGIIIAGSKVEQLDGRLELALLPLQPAAG